MDMDEFLEEYGDELQTVAIIILSVVTLMVVVIIVLRATFGEQGELIRSSLISRHCH